MRKVLGAWGGLRSCSTFWTGVPDFTEIRDAKVRACRASWVICEQKNCIWDSADSSYCNYWILFVLEKHPKKNDFWENILQVCNSHCMNSHTDLLMYTFSHTCVCVLYYIHMQQVKQNCEHMSFFICDLYN